jgi:hypothetical protein
MELSFPCTTTKFMEPLSNNQVTTMVLMVYFNVFSFFVQYIAAVSVLLRKTTFRHSLVKTVQRYY